MAHKLLNSYLNLNNIGYNSNVLKTLLHIFVAKSFFSFKKGGLSWKKIFSMMFPTLFAKVILLPKANIQIKAIFIACAFLS